MVARRSKLLAAGLVLAAGVALAWPLRRTELLSSGRRGVVTSAVREAANDPVVSDAHVAAKPPVANAADAGLSVPRDRDPFANVPAPAAAAEPPVFSTISSGAAPLSLTAPTEPPTHRIHIVHPGDSLERLAKRYLGDEVRALEIFDLNRDVLDNPHVLRLGTELRIPLFADDADDI